MAALDQLQGLNNLVSLIGSTSGKSGKQKTTGSSTSTTKSDMTQEGMDRVLNQILAGPGGVKDISGAARGAGLYNSTTETQMLNDLNARAAGELEKQRAGETTTTESEQTIQLEQPGVGLGGIGKSLGMMALGKPLLGGLSNMMEGGSFLEGAGLDKLFGGASSAAPAAAGALASPATFTATSPVFGLNGGSGTTSAGLGSILGGSSGSVGNIISGLGSSGIDLSNVGVSSSFDLGTSLGSMGNFTPAAGGSFALNAVPGAGSFLSGLLGGVDPSDQGAGIFSGAIPGALAGGPVGAVMGVVMSILGSALGGVSIVCTALESRGLLDSDEYKEGQKYLQELNPYTKQGYYKLFTTPAFKIAKGDKFWTAVCGPFARQRTSLIARKYGWKRWVKYPLGTITKVVGEPICWAVGHYQEFKFRRMQAKAFYKI